MTASSDPAADAFVGRGRELAMLERCAAEARNGEPRVVVIEGPAGIGKSALLTRFLRPLPDAGMLRASGAESEMALPYGLIGQLLPQLGASADLGSRDTPLAAADAAVVGADLAVLLGKAHPSGRLVVLAVDDLHWTDPESAAALLFALRRIHGSAFLAVLSARPAEFGLLGDGWRRFSGGDYRVCRVCLGGLTIEDVQSLALAIGPGELSRRAASRLVSHSGGNPAYCRAVLDESDPGTWDGPGDALPVPRQLAGTAFNRIAALTPAARKLADAAAILGRSCSLTTAAALACQPDPVPAFGELVVTGLVTEQVRGSGNRILFLDPLTHHVIQNEIAPVRRRLLHQQAAALVGSADALGHRVAAAAGPDAALAADLEIAAHVAEAEPASRDRMAQAAAWLAQASALSPGPGDASRLILDALDVLLRCGDVAEAEALAPRVAAAAGRGPRQSAILGHLDLLAGRPARAEARLSEAWQAHDPAREPLTGAHAAAGLLSCCLISGRLREAVSWGERAVDAAGADVVHRQHALCALALALAHSQRCPEALDLLDSVPACAGEAPLSQSDALVARGMIRVIMEDLEAAVSDLSTAAGRRSSGVPIRNAGLCLGYLAEAEHRLGSWDDAALHAELAVTLARDAGRVSDYSFVHSLATLVPAGRGDWAAAAAHADAARAAARTAGSGLGIAAWAAARAVLGAARGDHEEVLRAADAVRRTGRVRPLGSLGIYGWRPLEVDALIALGRLDDAGKALAEIDASLSASSPASTRIAAARLRGTLAGARGDAVRSARAFEDAWGHARGVRLPFQLAQLELEDGRRLRRSARRPEAIARLRSARGRLSQLGARPYVSVCDQELAACGVQLRRQDNHGAQAAHGAQGSQSTLGLSATELAVARLVAAGHSNREAAAELYVSVKGIEFHLSNIFAKLGIHSRRDLADRLGEDAENAAEGEAAAAGRVYNR
jgi:DNA-binding CsgD family transcriptional regulator